MKHIITKQAQYLYIILLPVLTLSLFLVRFSMTLIDISNLMKAFKVDQKLLFVTKGCTYSKAIFRLIST
jgi:hypothetical protein